MKLYLGLAKPLLLYLYLPLVLIGLMVLFSKVKSWKSRAWVVPLYLFLAYAIPLGDVTWHSWNMAKVCPKAGLHVYRTVVVDGFMPGDEYYVSEIGYHFVESRDRNNDGFVTRWEASATGVQRLDNVPAKSEWERVSGGPQPDHERGVTVSHENVRNRVSQEIIAEIWYFSAWRGWIDAWINSLINNSAGGCGGGVKLHITEVLIPSKET